MPQYSYKAKAGPDQIKTGTITAENEVVVVKKLKQEGLFPLSITETNPVPANKRFARVNSKDISSFTRQLANLVHSGFSLARALTTLQQQTQHPGLKKLIQDLNAKIEKGASFSDSLNDYPELFSSFYVSLVKIGETSGRLDDTLNRLADFKEREDELISQVRSALTYPAFVFVIGVLTFFLLMTFFVPRLVGMFADFGQALPLATQIVISVSTFLNRFWWLVIVGVAAMFIFCRAYYKSEKNRLGIDSFLLKIPKVKDMITMIEISRLSFALALLLQSGIPMHSALGIVTLSMDNRLFRKKVGSFQERISKGQSLSSCFSGDKLFPPILANMTAVGEESGELTEMLFRVAATFETEVNRTVKTVVSMIEPTLILFSGLMVVVLVLSILLPIFQLDVFGK